MVKRQFFLFVFASHCTTMKWRSVEIKQARLHTYANIDATSQSGRKWGALGSESSCKFQSWKNGRNILCRKPIAICACAACLPSSRSKKILNSALHERIYFSLCGPCIRGQQRMISPNIYTSYIYIYIISLVHSEKTTDVLSTSNKYLRSSEHDNYCRNM